MSTSPQFNFYHANIKNHLNQDIYHVRRMVDIQPTDEFLESIVAVCNEEKIYNWLFRARLQGKAYPKSDAQWFHQWGSDGWNHNTHFLFIVVDRHGKAVGHAILKLLIWKRRKLAIGQVFIIEG